MHYATYLFNYGSFQQDSRRAIEAAKIGNYHVVAEQAERILGGLKPRSWILEGHGTSLREYHQLDPAEPAYTGFCFLLLLSKHLYSFPSEPELFELDVVSQVVMSLGWPKSDVQLLQLGMSTAVLVKPESVTDPIHRPSPNDPRWKDPAYYWWWVRPLNAYYSGWWNVEQVTDLHSKLLQLRQDIINTDPASLALAKSRTIEQWNAYYERTIQLFRTAKNKDLGVFYVCS